MRRPNSFRSAYFIEGQQFPHAKSVHRFAVSEKGWQEPESVIKDRLTCGATTWDELLRPVNKKLQASMKEMSRRKHEEMASVIAELDARKRAISA